MSITVCLNCRLCYSVLNFFCLYPLLFILSHLPFTFIYYLLYSLPFILPVLSPSSLSFLKSLFPLFLTPWVSLSHVPCLPFILWQRCGMACSCGRPSPRWCSTCRRPCWPSSHYGSTRWCASCPSPSCSWASWARSPAVSSPVSCSHVLSYWLDLCPSWCGLHLLISVCSYSKCIGVLDIIVQQTAGELK